MAIFSQHVLKIPATWVGHCQQSADLWSGHLAMLDPKTNQAAKSRSIDIPKPLGL
ncbi:hypothetical protein [Photobacterium gaetbulicola]|uniref:hypothetical protein n=1 Tax=Photobacterium gaetbulicola TaxID=1295392 RepID=UPI000B027D08|nr:hypothetical protein [Photobacterium gaetbulicola]